MTITNKFSALDNREAAILDDLSGDARIAFETLCAEYNADFRPETNYERDTVYCLTTLRWGIDRVRSCEETARAAFHAHGYLTPKMKLALDEFANYLHELNLRYEYYFSAYWRMKQAA